MIENFGDNVNTNGFDKRPKDKIKGGRKPSIKNQLVDLLESEGNLTIQANQVIQIKDSGDIVIKVPTQMQMAMKLSSWAMSKKGNDSLKALQMIIDQVDGKGQQTINHNVGNFDISQLYDSEDKEA